MISGSFLHGSAKDNDAICHLRCGKSTVHQQNSTGISHAVATAVELARLPAPLSIHHLHNLDLISTNYSGVQRTMWNSCVRLREEASTCQSLACATVSQDGCYFFHLIYSASTLR